MVRPLPDRGRGHPDRGDDGRHRLDLGDLPRIPRHCRAPAQGRSITACISAIRRCACTRWARGAGSRKKPPRTICGAWSTRSPRRSRPARSASRPRARRRTSRPDDDAGRQPHRRLGRDRRGSSARWASSMPASSRSAPTSRAARRRRPASNCCARSPSTPAGRSCSACWRPSKASTPTRGISRPASWTRPWRKAAACTARRRRARSTRCSRSNPICRSTCCRPGRKSARCPWPSRRRGCATPRCAPASSPRKRR